MFVSIKPMRIFKERKKEGIFISKPRSLGYKHSHGDELSYALEAFFFKINEGSLFLSKPS